MYKNLKENGFEHYIIYDDGRVYNSKKNIFISGDVNNCGYCRVQLYSNGNRMRFFRHRLVAEYFLENEENKPFVNHKDGNKKNNNIHNLEWCTQSENEKHKFLTLGAKKTTKKVMVIYPDMKEKIFNSFKDAYIELGIKQQLFSRYVKNGIGAGCFKKYKFVKV